MYYLSVFQAPDVLFLLFSCTFSPVFGPSNASFSVFQTPRMYFFPFFSPQIYFLSVFQAPDVLFLLFSAPRCTIFPFFKLLMYFLSCFHFIYNLLSNRYFTNSRNAIRISIPYLIIFPQSYMCLKYFSTITTLEFSRNNNSRFT